MPSDLELNQFRDSKDRLWTFRVTAQNAMDLKQNHGVDVRFVENPQTMMAMLDGDLKILDAMAIVLLKQLEAKEITASALFEEMDGPVLENAIWAFVHGCLFFSPSHKRAALLEWAQKLRSAQTQLGSSTTQKVRSMKVDEQTINRLVDQHWEN